MKCPECGAEKMRCDCGAEVDIDALVDCFHVGHHDHWSDALQCNHPYPVDEPCPERFSD